MSSIPFNPALSLGGHYYDHVQGECRPLGADGPNQSLEPNAPDPLATEKFNVAAMRRLKPNTANVRERLTTLASYYKKALEHNDLAFARQCQLLGAEYIRFIEQNKMNRNAFREVAKQLGIHFPTIKSLAVKLGNLGKYTPSALVGKVAVNIPVIFSSEHDPKLTDSRLEVRATPAVLKGGLKHYEVRLYLDGEREAPTVIGDLVKIPPGPALKAHYKVGDTSQQTAELEGYAVFSSANYSIDTRIPASLSIVDGKAYNLYVAPYMEGIVVIKDGRPQILSSRETDIFQAAETALTSQGTLFQTNLLVYGGRNLVPASSKNDQDIRRVLITFNDGSYGILNLSEYISLYELGRILEKIPGIIAAVNFDTGGSNVGGWHDARFNFTSWGMSGYTSSTTLFYVK